MAGAPSIFSASAVTELVKLEGRAKLTFPTADQPHFRVERAVKLSKIKYAALAFNQPDDEFQQALLKSYQKVSEDAQNVQVALRYETLPGLPLTGISNSFLDLIPPEFRAAEQYTTTTEKIDPSVSPDPDAVSETVLSSTVQMDTAVEGTKINITRPAGAWPVLTGYEVSDETLGETANVIRTIGSGLLPEEGLFVLTSTVTPLGVGNLGLKSTTEFVSPNTWPVLQQVSLGGLDLIPADLRAASQITEVRMKVDPNVDPNPDALSSTVVESSVMPETKDRSEKRTTSITGTSTLSGHIADSETLGVSALTTKLFVTDGTAPTLGYLILTSAVTPTGMGQSVSTTTQVPSWPVLTNQTLGNAGLVPEKFKAAAGYTEVVTRMDATTSPAPDALSATVLQSTIEQQGHYLSVKRTISFANSPPTLIGFQLNQATLGQSASVTESLVTTGSGDAPDSGFLVLSSDVDPIGNGQSLKHTVQFTGSGGDTWPVLTEDHLGNVALLPELFRYSIKLTTTDTRVAAGAAPDSLSATVLESLVMPETKDRSVKRTTALASSSFATFVGYRMNEKGQVETISKSLVSTSGSTLSPDETYTSAEITPLGNTLSLETIAVLPNVSTDAFVSYAGTGGDGTGNVLEKTTRSFVATGTVPGGFPKITEDVISDTIEEDTLQRAYRVLKQLTDTSGVVLTGTMPIYTVPLEYDKRTFTQLWRSYSLVPTSYTLPALGAQGPTGSGVVIDARLTPMGAAPYFSANAMAEIEWCLLPAPRVEYPKLGFEFPAIFTFQSPFVINSIAAYYSGYPPPWPGNGVDLATFQLIPHRPAVRPARQTFTYSVGASNNFQTAFKVLTPGVSSRLFQIPPNCIHQAIQVTGTTGGNSYLIENIPASLPSAYNANDVLIVSCEERPVLGNIYENILTEISEDLLPSQFPPVAAVLVFKATAQAPIQQQPNSNGEQLILVSSSASDNTQTALVLGRNGSTFIRESVYMNGTAMVQTQHNFQVLKEILLSGAAIGTVSCLGHGSSPAGSIDFLDALNLTTSPNLTGQPNDGDTVLIEWISAVPSLSTSQTYRLKTTMALANDVQINPTAPYLTWQNLVDAITGTGIAGTTSSDNYYTGTLPMAHISAYLDQDLTQVHLYNDEIFQNNTNITYVLTVTSSNTNIVATAFSAGTNGPVLASIAPTGTVCFNDVYLNCSALVTSISPIEQTGTATSPTLVSVNTDGTPAIENNLPAGLAFVSDKLAVPTGIHYPLSIVMALAGTPTITPTYETSPTGLTGSWVAGVVGLPAIGSGNVFRVVLTENPVVYIRLKIYNSASKHARAVYAALEYTIAT